jgi:uncharacterized protein YegJ (DUF2314 family)
LALNSVENRLRVLMMARPLHRRIHLNRLSQDVGPPLTKARKTLPDFLIVAAAPKAGMEGFAVKVAIREGGNAEYFWITPFTSKDGTFSGEINNKPRLVRSVTLGQTITFGQSEIVDWMYMDGDKMKGNYTACALLKSASKQEAAEFKKSFGLGCDF